MLWVQVILNRKIRIVTLYVEVNDYVLVIAAINSRLNATMDTTDTVIKLEAFVFYTVLQFLGVGNYRPLYLLQKFLKRCTLELNVG